MLPRTFWRLRAIVAAVLLVGIGVAAYSVGREAASAAHIFATLRAFPRLAPALFVATYAVCGALMLPTLPLNLGAGFLWGTWMGAGLTVAGVTAGGAFGFLAARYVGAEWARVTLTHPIWLGLQREVVRQDWRAVAFARVNPAFPTALVNYFFGLTSIGFGRYLLATGISVAPMATLFAVIGHEAGELALTGRPPQSLGKTIMVGVPLVLVIGLAVWRRSRAHDA